MQHDIEIRFSKRYLKYSNLAFQWPIDDLTVVRWLDHPSTMTQIRPCNANGTFHRFRHKFVEIQISYASKRFFFFRTMLRIFIKATNNN